MDVEIGHFLSIENESVSQERILQHLDHYSERTLTFTTPKGRVSVGDGKGSIEIDVADCQFFKEIMLRGNLGLGECYAKQLFDVRDDKLPEFLTTLLRSGLNTVIFKSLLGLLSNALVVLKGRLMPTSYNVGYHYDIGEDLFDSMLEDEYRQYSCGYVTEQNADIDTIQRSKINRILNKLDLQPGNTMLDIGCGYGGLVIEAATKYKVYATGITNSKAHFDGALKKIDEKGANDLVEVIYGDQKYITGTFDRIVSVGMIEHLKPSQYKSYVKNVANRLGSRGIGLLHFIGLNSAHDWHDPFIQKYIFPGSDTPRLSQFCELLEQTDLHIFDVENIVRHYEFTARRWREAFQVNKYTLSRYDEYFLRIWDYYLACGIAAASSSNLAVYQILFSKDQTHQYPLTRV